MEVLREISLNHHVGIDKVVSLVDEISSDKKRGTTYFTWPASFSLTFSEDMASENLYVDAVNNWQRSEASNMIVGNPNYTRIITSKNMTTYWYDMWFNIQPAPCVFNNLPTMLWEQPNLGYLGAFRDLDLDIYVTTGDTLWWFVQDNNIPIGIASNEGQAMINNYMAARPPASAFIVPSLCFPIYGTNMSNGSAPVLPSVFVMYAVRSTGIPLVMYYDGVTGNIRIDNGVSSLLQVGTDVYEFSSEVNSRIQPTPCVHGTTSKPIVTLPTFTRKVANATLDTQTLSVWANYPTPTTAGEFWYFDNTTSPVMIFNVMGSLRINFFRQMTPPPGVFNPPAQCKLVSMSDVPNFSKRISSFSLVS